MSGCGGSSSSPTSSSGTGSGFPNLPTLTASIVNNTITLNVDTGSVLATVGNAALVNASGRSFLVARTGQTTVSVVTAVCTHEQCTVSTFQSQVYECPCHGSQYNTSGMVLRGPATRALTQFTANFVNSVLTITTG